MRTFKSSSIRARNRTGGLSDVEEQPRRHPVLDLQQRMGNRAVQRHLGERSLQRAEDEEKSSPEKDAEQDLRHKLARTTNLLSNNLESLPNSFAPDERARKGPVILHVHQAFKATGILTPGMMESLQRALTPMDRLIDDKITGLRNLVREREEMQEGLDNPLEWSRRYYSRLLD